MLKVQNKLNVPNMVHGELIKPYGVKLIDCDINDADIQASIKSGCITVIENTVNNTQSIQNTINETPNSTFTKINTVKPITKRTRASKRK